jgi:DNA-binding NtrC family response regulator
MARSTPLTDASVMTRDVRVLHVDDDPALLDLTADILERVDDGVSVLSESDPTAAPDRIEREPVDCVVSDLRMPECDGLELCERVRRVHPELPFFLFTSESGSGLVDRAMEVGATDFIEKDPGIDQYKLLVNRIERSVEHHRARKRIVELETRLGIPPTA